MRYHYLRDDEGFVYRDPVLPSKPAKSSRVPVVVIDPEDPDQLKRLCDALDAVTDSGSLPDRPMTVRQLRIRSALRSLIEPPARPKPEEPTGLGAVVEDQRGKRWVRLNRNPDAPWVDPTTELPATVYRNIAAVRVLSEGVPS